MREPDRKTRCKPKMKEGEKEQMDEDKITADNEEKLTVQTTEAKAGQGKYGAVKPKSLAREVISWIVVIVTALFLGYGLNEFVLLKAEIPSGSMENTLMVGDRLIGNRLAYLFSSPKRGDIIMFDFPDDETKLYVKRVIGLPGEHVEIRDGLVYINYSETPLEEDYLKEPPNSFFGTYDVPEGCYFVMGDNRNNSTDSRRWNNPYVSEKKIRCKAWFRYKPDFGLVK